MQDGMKRRMTHTTIPGQKVENDQAQDRSRNIARNSLLICTLPQAGATQQVKKLDYLRTLTLKEEDSSQENSSNTDSDSD